MAPGGSRERDSSGDTRGLCALRGLRACDCDGVKQRKRARKKENITNKRDKEQEQCTYRMKKGRQEEKQKRGTNREVEEKHDKTKKKNRNTERFRMFYSALASPKKLQNLR